MSSRMRFVQRNAVTFTACALAALCTLTVLTRKPPPLLSPPCLDKGTFVSGPRSAGSFDDESAAARRWTEFRRCVTLEPAPCASTAAAELPATPPPYLELKAHFHDLLERTRTLRGLPMLEYGYRGPWMENVWLEAAACADYEAFYPLVPLFVQLTDPNTFNKDARSIKALLELFHGLRHDVIYVIVSEDDTGMGVLPPEDDCVTRNILLLSAGGWGNVALPLIMGVTQPDDYGGAPPPPPDTRNDVYSRSILTSFTGNIVTSVGGARSATVAALRASGLIKDEQFRHFYGSPQWKAVAHNTVLSLAPRGFGRSSFRSSELVQMGLPQLYVYDDVPWLPYWDPLHPDGRRGHNNVWGRDGLGLITNVAGIHNVTAGLCAFMLPPEAELTPENCPSGLPAGPPFVVHAQSKIARMRARARELAASHFTYAGVIARIREFFDTPWDADLVCINKPATRH